MSQVLTLWNKTSTLPQGKRIFSILFGRKAPYFASIRPRFVSIEPNRAELLIPGPRTIDGIEHLAAIFHPEVFAK